MKSYKENNNYAGLWYMYMYIQLSVTPLASLYVLVTHKVCGTYPIFYTSLEWYIYSY